MGLKKRRHAERAKYEYVYQGKYGGKRMRARLAWVASVLHDLPHRGSLLDVGCGRRFLIDHAATDGFGPTMGTDVVAALCDQERVFEAWAHKLPFADRSFDVVTMTDVIEHLLPEDEPAALAEMARVARQTVLIAANNLSSVRHGIELHINRRPYDEWDTNIRRAFPDWVVQRLETPKGIRGVMWKVRR